MLVVISDLHLTDGTSGTTISAGAFQLLAERLADLATGASRRADGGYRPIERIDLVLLGDVLDVIRSTRWLGRKVRPWNDPQTPAMAEAVQSITADILRRNETALGVLRALAHGSIRLPPATQFSRRAVTEESIAVPVRIHYMVGNHDWFFHLPGPVYDRVRRQVAVHLALATEPDRPFPHDPHESAELLNALRQHKVFARHGDIFDPVNFEGDRDASSLGDMIVIELVNRFSAEVERRLADELPLAARLGLREIDNIRPLLLIPVWIEGLLQRTCPAAGVRRLVKDIWNDLADDLLSLPEIRSRDSWRPADLVDGLQRALRFSQRVPIDWASSIAQWMHQRRGATTASYHVHAQAEQDFRNQRAKHIVYGHTHHTEQVPLDSSHADGYVLNQMYFNAGTWRRVYQQTQVAPRELEFVPHDTMSFLAFYHGDERKGRPFETWTGSLGVSPNKTPAHRVDSRELVDPPPTLRATFRVGCRGFASARRPMTWSGSVHVGQI